MSSKLEQVVVVGVGARTPLGLDAQSSAAAVRGAISAIGDHPYMVDKTGEPMSVAMDALLGPHVTGVERFYALARTSVYEALSFLPGNAEKSLHVATIVGLPESRPGIPPDLDREIVHRLADPDVLPLGSVATIHGGHSGGLMAMEEAWRKIRHGEAEVCLAGGVDSYMEPDTLEWLDWQRQLMSAENRSGFPPGEGAAFCLLASRGYARLHQMKTLAEILAIATTREKNHMNSNGICTGTGLSEAISRVSGLLKLPEEKIDFTYCDLNGERYRSEEFAFTVLRTQNAFTEASDNLTPSDCWGDMGAASGPLFANLAIESNRRNYAKGARCLVWTGSESGYRSAAILRLHGGSKEA